MPKIFNKKNLLILGLILCVILYFVGQLLGSHKVTVTVPIPPTVTTSPSATVLDTNPVENTPEWNATFQKEMTNYEGSRNQTADAALSQIRLAAPVTYLGNTVDYSYKTATYTITLVSPYLENQNKVLSWFDKQGVNQNIIKTLRINWVQK